MSIEIYSLSASARQLKTPLATVSRNVFELESHVSTKTVQPSRKLVLNPSDDLPKSTP